MKILVLIAQAHGKNTPGKCSPDKKLEEWWWSREVSQMIKEGLERINIDCIIINPEYEEVSLYEQAQRANKIYRDRKEDYDDIILISPHVNAAPGRTWSTASGWTAYVYTKPSNKSKKLAQCMAGVAYDTWHLEGNRYIPECRYFNANFAILRQTAMPAVLTENMFMTNLEDKNFLLSDRGKEIITNVHIRGIINYIANK